MENIVNKDVNASSPSNAEGIENMSQCFQIRGKVQNVMFRQTVIRAMIKRGLTGGASNDKYDKKLVHLTLNGKSNDIQNMIEWLAKGEDINDWGARASQVKEVPLSSGRNEHDVTTENVNDRNWDPNITMYI